MWVWVCVCVCVRERQRERERVVCASVCIHLYTNTCMFQVGWTLIYIELETVYVWKMKVKVTQLCLTLCNSMDYIYTVCGILMARILEWVAVLFSRGSSQPRDQTWVSCIADTLPSELPGKPSKWDYPSIFIDSTIIYMPLMSKSLYNPRADIFLRSRVMDTANSQASILDNLHSVLPNWLNHLSKPFFFYLFIFEFCLKDEQHDYYSNLINLVHQ